MEGLYKVEYDISGGAGRSVLYAHDGAMLGGNTAFAHFGTYQTIDGEIVARLRTRRHSASPQPRSLVSSDSVTISIRGRPQGAVWHFLGEVVEDRGSVFWAVMTPLGRDDIPPPGAVGEGGITSGLYSINIRMLDGLAGGQTGVMLLLDGRILGGDAFFYYLGAYLRRTAAGRASSSTRNTRRRRQSIRCLAATRSASAFPAAAMPLALKSRRRRWSENSASVLRRR